MEMTLSPEELFRQTYESFRARTVAKLLGADSKVNAEVSELFECRAAFATDIEYGRALALRDLQSEEPANTEPDTWLMLAYEGELGAAMQAVANRAISAYARMLADRAVGQLFTNDLEGVEA